MMSASDFFLKKERQQTELAMKRYRASVINSQLCSSDAKDKTLSVVGSPLGLGVAFGVGCLSGYQTDKTTVQQGQSMLGSLLKIFLV